MTPRQNLLAVFAHQMPEWVPVVAMVDNFQVPVGMAEEFESNLNIVSFSRRLGLSILERYDESRYEKLAQVRRYEQPLIKEVHKNVSVETRRDGDKLHRTWETPYGHLSSTFQLVSYQDGSARGVSTEFPVEYPVKGPPDFKAFASVFEDVEYEVDPTAIPSLENRVAEIGQDGITTLAAPSSPLGMAVRYYLGVETLAYAYSDHRAPLESLLNVIGESYLKKQRLLAGLNADGTINFDDTTTRAISPAWAQGLVRTRF